MPARAGVDLGGTKIQAVVVDQRGRVRGAARRATPTAGGPTDVVRELAGAVEEAAAEAGEEPGRLRGVGVGSPGDVDDKAGTVTSAKNLPGWTGSFNVRKALSKHLGAIDVRLGNDVDVATVAEFEL